MTHADAAQSHEESSGAAGALGPSPSLAERLDHLFKTDPRGPFTNDRVADALQEAGGPTASGTYLWQLRTGRRGNPTKNHLEALAKFFGVPVAYFFDDSIAEQVNTQLETLNRLKEAGVQSVALRAIGLSRESLDPVLALLDQVRRLEGLPPEPEQHQP
ncbi:helix-turn-helix domain-containing protein [Streptomyces avermitilis]